MVCYSGHTCCTGHFCMPYHLRISLKGRGWSSLKRHIFKSTFLIDLKFAHLESREKGLSFSVWFVLLRLQIWLPHVGHGDGVGALSAGVGDRLLPLACKEGLKTAAALPPLHWTGWVVFHFQGKMLLVVNVYDLKWYNELFSTLQGWFLPLPNPFLSVQW